MPIATPAAPYARAATRPRPLKKPPAPSTSDLVAHRVDDLGVTASVVGTVPVWPPPSAP